MNWLGLIIANRLCPTDDVLDLGCGIMQATGRLPVRNHVGVDCYEPYLARIGEPVLLAKLPDATDLFADKSFDVVLLLDVVEHLSKADALKAIEGAERIARREVIVFTPDGPCPQDGWNAWGMGENGAQAHQCSFTFDELANLDYVCSRYPNRSEQAGEIVSVLGIKCVSQ